MIVNLLSNAIESIPVEAEFGSVFLHAFGTDDKVIITVEDDGVGIPIALRERLFEPFVTGREGGLGLGLSIVLTIVEGLEGSIEVGDRGHGKQSHLSRVPRGSRFVVRLPRITPKQRPLPTQSNGFGNSLSPPIQSAKRVLIIDDEELILESVKAALFEHDVTTTSDPE